MPNQEYFLDTAMTPVALTALRQTLQQVPPLVRAQDPDATIHIVQEGSLEIQCAQTLPVEQFTIVISRLFSALLLVNPCEGEGHPVELYAVTLSFDPRAIAAFVQQLLILLPQGKSLHGVLARGVTLVRGNHGEIQSRFTLQLMAELLKDVNSVTGHTLEPDAPSTNSSRAPLVLGPVPPNAAESDNGMTASAPHSSGEDPSSTVPSPPLMPAVSRGDANKASLAEHKQALEQAMQQTQSAEQAKSEFLAAMSHELRTPLTYILGMSATLLRWSTPGSPDEISDRQRRYLQNIHDQGEHLLELINDLLDLSQLETGYLGLEFQEFSLSLLIQQVLNVYRGKAQRRGVTLELDSHLVSGGDRMIADPHRLQQIVSNLLSNAIKFTHRSGKVTLRLAMDQRVVEIQVRDTGIGISEHHQTVIFQKFKQLDSSYHREYEGTGLGLALTKQLVELHGGRVDCDSTVGVGTVFTVTLPRNPMAPQLRSASPSSSSPLNQPLGRIALINDDDEYGHFISDMLTAAGYQLVWMLEGVTAIGQLEMLRPSVVIINEQHIHRNAEAANIVHLLRRNPIVKRSRIVVASHHGEPSELALTDGADLLLPHPLQPEDLLHKIGLLMASVQRDSVSVFEGPS